MMPEWGTPARRRLHMPLLARAAMDRPSTRVVFALIESGGFPNRLGFDSTCWPGMEAGRYGQTLFE